MENMAYSSYDKVSSYMNNSSDQEARMRIEMTERERRLEDRQMVLDKREKMLNEKDKMMDGNSHKISELTHPTYLRKTIQ